MVLSAILKLDAGAFTTPLGKSVEGIKAAIRIAGDLGAKLTEAFDLGGALSDLAAQTGESVGDLMVLKQAFEDTGVGGEALGQTLAMMRRSLAGISESGAPTKQIFNQLGLDIGKIKGMGASEQLQTIAAAINDLRTPSEQSAAAMEIFGRSGAKMMTFFKDPEAMAAAAASLGGLPGLMDRNAAAFDAVSDRIGRIKGKSQGLWAGIAEGLLPLADQVTSTLDGIDITGIGQRIGETLGTLVEMVRAAPLGQLVKDGIIVGLSEAVNWTATGFVKIGGYLWKALSTPLSYFSAAIGKAIQEAMELIGRIPKVGKWAGLDGFKAQSFGEIRRDAKDDIDEIVNTALGSGKVELIDVSAEKARLAEVWSAAAVTYKKEVAAVQKEASDAAAMKQGTRSLEGAGSGGGGAAGFDTDSLARIGGYLGAFSGRTMESIALRTARATEALLRLAQREKRTVAVWAT